VIAPLFWAVDRRHAAILFLLVLASGYVNTSAKLLVHTPRPDPTLARVLDFRPYQSGSPAFPSGHTQNAVVVWTYLAIWIRRRWFSGLAVAMIVLISFSRLYLAVHFPIDIAGGLVLGAAIMLAVPRLLERWADGDFRMPRAAAAAILLGSLVLALATTDLSMTLISSSLVGFLAGAVWLPQAPLRFSSAAQLCAGVGGGILLLLLLSVLPNWLPRTPLAIYMEVAVLWVIALWAYPQVLHRLWLSRGTAVAATQ